MNRPVLSLSPYLWRAVLTIALLGGWIFLVAGSPSRDALMAVWVIASIIAFAMWPQWLWPLICRIRQFRTVRDGQILLHYEPELMSKWDIQTLLSRCNAQLGCLTDRFGRPLQGPVVIFLFAKHQDIAKVFGSMYGGTAHSAG